MFKLKYIDNVISENLKHFYLTDNELQLVFDCLNSIGATDCENQIALLNGYKVEFERLYVDNNDKMKKSDGFYHRIFLFQKIYQKVGEGSLCGQKGALQLHCKFNVFFPCKACKED